MSELPTLIVASYGMGTNSTAYLIELAERGERVDAILAADTGGEFPEIYDYARMFSDWLVARGYPAVTFVGKGWMGRARRETLEDDCLRKSMLPSLSYGYKGCSHKFKIEPQELYLNNYAPARAVWKAGGKVTKLLGYDADEPHRAAIPEDAKYRYRYPCLEFGWGRAECEARIVRAGLPLPGKSSCFFCPSTTKPQIIRMMTTHPLLLARALSLEHKAETSGNFKTVKGLGRRLNWRNFISTTVEAVALGKPVDLTDTETAPVCGGCYDVSDDDTDAPACDVAAAVAAFKSAVGDTQ